MKSAESSIARQIEYQQWLEDIRECNSRPIGMTVEDWCRERGMSRNTYYWRLKALRNKCLLSARPSMDVSSAANEPSPANIPPTTEVRDEEIIKRIVPLEAPTGDLAGNPNGVSIKLGRATIELSESISDGFLLRIIEAVAHA